MGVQAPASSILRTIWTTAMDRYFIDLMLEQVGRGSRVDGHLFSKKAWRHMTLLFNEKFKLQYSRDHLKNRHKTLRRVYRAVKNLLEQNGFTWDEIQHMVTADDHIWSNYTKAHPEARSYRTKSIPYYSDMCKIFKNLSIGRHNDSTVNEDHNSIVRGTNFGGIVGGMCPSTTSIGSEAPVDGDQGLASSLDRSIDMSELDEQQLTIPTNSLLSTNGQQLTMSTNLLLSPNDTVDILHEMVAADTTIENGKQENTPNLTENLIDSVQPIPDSLDSISGSRSRTYWQPPMDSYFIELMLEEMKQGNQFDGTFRKHAWIHMTELFNAKFGYKYDTVVLKNRYKTLKRQYTAIKFLLDQKGFVWDDTRQMVTADDHIWHEYIKVHPDAKQYITRPVPHFNHLSVIFKDVTADEGYSYNVDQQNEGFTMESDREMSFQQSMLLMPAADGNQINGVQESSSHLERDDIIFDQKNKRPFGTLSTCQNPKRPRRRNDEGVLDGHFCQPAMLQRSTDEDVASALREMAAVVSSLSDRRIEPYNSTLTEDVVHALQSTPDIDDDLILDGCDLLEDEKKAKTFLSLDVRLRKKWLMRKLRA